MEQDLRVGRSATNTSAKQQCIYNVFIKLMTVPKIYALWFYGRNFILCWSQHVSAAHVTIFRVMT